MRGCKPELGEQEAASLFQIPGSNRSLNARRSVQWMEFAARMIWLADVKEVCLSGQLGGS